LSAGFSPEGAVVSLLTGAFRLATALASFNMSSVTFFLSSMRTTELICCRYSSGPGLFPRTATFTLPSEVFILIVSLEAFIDASSLEVAYDIGGR
jgi:hypothetical protein